MFAVLLNKELLGHLHTFRFAAAVVAALTLVIISLVVLGNDYEQRLSSYERLEDQHALDALEVKVPSRLQPVLLRPPSPLGIFAAGAERRVGDLVRIRRWEVPRKAEDSFSSTSMLDSVQSFDLLTIFTFVASLFGVLLSYDAISGEKSAGTLKVLSVNGASLGTIFSAKFSAATIAVALPFIFAMIGAPLFLMTFFGIQLTGPHWLALGIMSLSLIAYIAFFVALGLLCSSLTSRPSTSLVLSLLGWTVVVFILPVAVKNIVSTFHPLPDPNEIIDFERQTLEEAQTRTRELYGTHVPSGGRYGQWSTMGEGIWLFDAPAPVYRGLEAFSREKEPLWFERADSIWNKAQEHRREFKAQAGLLDIASVISPAHQFQTVFTTSSATDYESLESFLDAARRFRRAMLDEFRNRGYFGENAIGLFSRRPVEEAHSPDGYGRRAAEYERLDEEGKFGMETIDFRNFPSMDVKLVPTFEYEPNQPNIDRALVGLLLLAMWVAVLYTVGFALLQRYDIR